MPQGSCRHSPEPNGSVIRIQGRRSRPGDMKLACHPLRGAATESRLIRAWAMTWSETTRASPPLRWRILRNSSSTAEPAMAAIGCRTVVSSGQTVVAVGVSSKPTTERSRGTSRPRRWATDTAAAAMSSLLAKIAVGGALACEQLFGRLQAGAIGEVALLNQRRIDGEPGC